MRILIYLLAMSAFGQGTDKELHVARNFVKTKLSASLSASATSFTVANATNIVQNQLLVIDGNEVVKVCSVSGTTVYVGYASCPNVDGRGFDSTTAVAHATNAVVADVPTAAHHNALADQVKILTAAAGAGISPVPYAWTAQAPGGSLSAGGVGQSITLTPCPLGIAGTPAFPTYVRLSGGTGTAEATLIVAGGTCTSGAATGTILVTPTYAHSGAWTVGPANVGLQEAVNTHPTGGTITIPVGTNTIYAKVSFGAYHQFVGSGTASIVSATSMYDTSQAAFEYLSTATLGAVDDLVVGIKFADFYLAAKNGVKINATVIPTYQYNILGAKFENLRLNGTYATAVDANKNTDTVPLVAETIGYGVGIQCNQCFRMKVDNSQIENYGIGVYISGDESQIVGNRIQSSAWLIYIDGSASTTLFHGNSNVVRDNKLGNILRMGGVVLNQTWHTVIEGNYMESYCPSSRFVWSYGGAGTAGPVGTKIIANRMDDPNNAGLCSTGAANTTPIFSLDEIYGTEIAHNFMLVGAGAVPGMTFGTTYYGATRPNQYHVHDNSPSWPEPTGYLNPVLAVTYPVQPGVVVGDLNPYIFRANNVGGAVTHSAGVTTMPWNASGVTGRFVLTDQACCWLARFYPKDAGYTQFAVRVTGTKTGATGITFVQVQYIGTGTTTVYTGNQTFTATTETETKLIYVSVPAGEIMTGRWEVSVDNTQAEIEQLELSPVQDTLVGGSLVLTGSITGATTGAFSGALSAASLALGGAITGATTGAFSGAVSAGSLALSGALSGVTTAAVSGAITSTLATGSAPLVVASTTPVANLHGKVLAYNPGGTQQVGAHAVFGKCTLGTDCAVTLTGAAAFTNTTSYYCAATDQTSAAAVKVVNTAGGTVTFTGTGTDVISFVCIGN